MAHGVIRLTWDQTSILWVTLAEPYRNHEKHTEPFAIADIHPLYSGGSLNEVADAGPDWNQWNQIKRHYKVTKLHHGRQGN